jgi:replicative DNA helicase
MDRMLGGLHNSDLLILAGRPSMGKTSLATNIAFNVAKRLEGRAARGRHHGTVDGGVVGFFSLEMSSAQLAQRILSEAAEIPSELIRKGDLTEAEFQRYLRAAGELEHCPLYIDDTPALPISQLAARARRLKRAPKGLDLLIVDYLQLVRPATAKDSRVNEVSEITQGSRPSPRNSTSPSSRSASCRARWKTARTSARSSDLRESGSIEQDADVVMFVYRGEYYKEREKPGEDNLEAMTKWQQDMEALHGKAEVIIGKQRHGPVGNIELSFEGKFTRFGNLVKPWQQGAALTTLIRPLSHMSPAEPISQLIPSVAAAAMPDPPSAATPATPARSSPMPASLKMTALNPPRLATEAG